MRPREGMLNLQTLAKLPSISSRTILLMGFRIRWRGIRPSQSDLKKDWALPSKIRITTNASNTMENIGNESHAIKINQKTADMPQFQ